MPVVRCESWTKFSAQTSCGEQNSGHFAEVPGRLHVHGPWPRAKLSRTSHSWKRAGENDVKICSENMSSEQRVCRSSTRTQTGTRAMLSDTNRDEHWQTAFSNFACHSICDSFRWICSLKIHNAIRRQNSFPVFAGSPFIFGGSVFALICDREVRAAKPTNRWVSGSWWR